MKVLVVAHPDDENLFFLPETFDRIVICFLGIPDRPHMAERRRKALAEHPLKEKIVCLQLDEPTGPGSQSEKFLQPMLAGYAANEGWTEVTTHAADGEYGHPQHRLVFAACMQALNIPVNGRNPEEYRKIRGVYFKHACWTWDT